MCFAEQGFECTFAVSASRCGANSVHETSGLSVSEAGTLLGLVGVRIVVDDIESGA